MANSTIKMKVRDSGMPAPDYWNSFFDVECMLGQLFGELPLAGDVVEFGCGYGTFTLPAAKLTLGAFTALDIEPQLIERLRQLATGQKLDNIRPRLRDFVAEGSGLRARSQQHAMIYNLLHLEAPVALLREAWRVLVPGGRLSVIHWRCDIPTPRGPALEIRPTPAQCRGWLEAVGFCDIEDVDLSACCAYHYGLVATRSE